jgi:hypothetical protein
MRRIALEKFGPSPVPFHYSCPGLRRKAIADRHLRSTTASGSRRHGSSSSVETGACHAAVAEGADDLRAVSVA